MGATQQKLDPARTGFQARGLEDDLEKLVVGQQEAVHEIVNIYQMYLTGLNPPGRPIGNFLFLGPTGSGKTRIVEATAESLAGDARAMIKIDCAEFQHSHEIAKLIGSPPGYLGHRETHPLLSQEMLDQHHSQDFRISFVLFDEIEKASDALWNLLLGILDKATLTLGDNRKVDFSRAMVFMTSNLGAAEMSSIMNPKVGFGAQAEPPRKELDENLTAKIRRSGTEAARRKFTPEFVNRLDKIVVFKALGEGELRKILDIELSMVQERVFSSADPSRAFVFRLTDPAKEHMLTAGTDMRYGARHLKRTIERMLVQPLSNLMATDQISGGDLVCVDYESDTGGLLFVKEAEGLEVQHMSEMVGSNGGPIRKAAGVGIVTPRKAPAARSTRRG